MKNKLTLIVDDRSHPFRVWARRGVPEGFSVIEHPGPDWRAAIEQARTEYVSILPCGTRIEPEFLASAVEQLDTRPEISVFMGQSIVRNDDAPTEFVQKIDGLERTQFLDPQNFAQECVIDQAPDGWEWQGFVFRRSALLSKELAPVWGREDACWGLVMAMGLTTGLCLQNKRVAVRLTRAEGSTESADNRVMPMRLQAIRECADAVVKAGAPQSPCDLWASKVMNRWVDASLQQTNRDFKAARLSFERIDGDSAIGKLLLYVTGFSRRCMEMRMRKRYHQLLEKLT